MSPVSLFFHLFSLWEIPEYALALVEAVIRAVMLSALSRPPAPQLPLPVLEGKWGQKQEESI